MVDIVHVALHVYAIQKDISLNGTPNCEELLHYQTKPSSGSLLHAVGVIVNIIPSTGLADMDLALNTLSRISGRERGLVCLKSF